MATKKELIELALHAVRGTAPTNYSVDTVDEALRGEFATMCDSLNSFQRYKYDIFDIMIAAADEAVPNKVIDAMGIFAEVKQVGNNQKALFKTGLRGRGRAKKFLTQVGLSGVYETFRLDSDTFEVQARAVGGGVSIDFDRFLDGAETLSDLMDIITEGLIDATYGEVQKALIAAADAAGRPDANIARSNGFDADLMFKLVSTVKTYGGNAVIFATPEFVGEMGPDAIVPVGANYQGIYHPQDLDAIHYQGYINIFRGTPIVQLPQSFTDESNTTTWLNPRFAYVLPVGKERVVKVVYEGATEMWDAVNRDRSIEIMVSKKIGAAVMTHNNWGIYENEALTDTSDFPYGI